MAAYNFKLQRVLTVRRLEEDQTKYKYYREKQKELQLENKISLLEDKQNDVFKFLRKNDNSVDEILRARDFLYRQRIKITDCAEKLEEQKEKIDNIQQELIEKKKKKKMMEKLKEKTEEKFYRDFYHKQQKILDDLSLNFSNRQEVIK